MDADALADELLAAWDGAHCIALPSARPAGLDLAQGYAVAQRLRERRRARGERQLGWKIGFTNRNIWPVYRVYAPVWAPVWDSTTELLEGTHCRLALTGLSQPRLEPEIAFGIGRAPRAGMTLAQLQRCIDWVAHAFEVVHTHCAGWCFAAADTAADFGLHGRLRVGPRVPVRAWPTLAADLSALELELHRDDRLVERGRGAFVLDGPLQSLHTLVESMARTTPHWRIAPGDVVTTGTLTDAQPLLPGQSWQTRLSDARLAALTLQTIA